VQLKVAAAGAIATVLESPAVSDATSALMTGVKAATAIGTPTAMPKNVATKPWTFRCTMALVLFLRFLAVFV
jgi:hypothetical protein